MSYTPEMLAEFEEISRPLKTMIQADRIEARFKLLHFKEIHGKAVIDEIFALFQERDERRIKR